MEAQADQMSMPEAPKEFMQMVSFRLGSENFALDILDVQEIIRKQPLTRVPGSSDVGGVIHLRGKILPVIALRERIGLAAGPEGPQRIVVMQKGAVLGGFLVDSVPEVLRVSSADIRPLQHIEIDQRGLILTGMGTDGLRGISAIHQSGGITLGQDEATSAVYGMPKACLEHGVLQKSLPLSSIAEELLAHFSVRAHS